MGNKKLKRFKEISTFSNVFEYPEGMQGKWHEVFENDNAITLELACGKGEYTVALAERYTNRNFIGVDLKGNRIWKGASYALQNNLRNAAFLRTQIEMIASYFAPAEVDEIWLTFPDPQLRLSRAKRRLTHPRFLLEYEKIMKPNGLLHLKTDSANLYNFTREVINWCDLELVSDIADIYSRDDLHDDLRIKTYYEGLNIAGTDKVYYLSWRIPAEWKRAPEEFTEHVKEKFANDETR